MAAYLATRRILFKDFREWAQALTAQVRQASEHIAETSSRPFLDLDNSHVRKEDLARQIAERDGIAEGLICVLRSVEPCYRNSLKLYDKDPTLLRAETTINNAADFKVLRPSRNDPNGPLKWLPLPKSVAELPRRAAVSQTANDRYLDALAAVEAQEPLSETVQALCQPLIWQGRRAITALLAAQHASTQKLVQLAV